MVKNIVKEMICYCYKNNISKTRRKRAEKPTNQQSDQKKSTTTEKI